MTTFDGAAVTLSVLERTSGTVPDITSTTVTTYVQAQVDISVSQIVLIVFALVMSLFIIFVNSATILVVRRTRSLHTLSNMYVVSLAATDVVVGVGLIPLSMFYVPSIRNRYYDRNMKLCLLVLGTNLGMAVVSTIHMVFIAIDRYLYIIRPYLYETVVSRKVVYIIIASTWSFGLFYALLPQAIHDQARNTTSCDITIVMPVGYMFYANVSIYTTSVAIDVAMYSQILLTAYRHRRVIQSKTIVVQPPRSSHVFTTSLCQREDTGLFHAKLQSELRQEASQQEEASNTRPQIVSSSLAWKKPTDRFKSVKFFMTVFGVYFICLTPTVVCMGVDYYWPLPRFLYNMFNLLGLLNSGMNFIIYFALNARFRYAVLKLFRYPGVQNLADTSDASFLDN
ncbi:unnamed protein product [Candidula unifasciata]|uniref:G-protein coupled receptors family 1 profile domain-containing protein n=1 Tax=Candidula unifasciata TaxID=100452 RepID=A0A8S4A2R2_9EUPU|nr:unnamed protein product [Candidula unifasciata]